MINLPVAPNIANSPIAIRKDSILKQNVGPSASGTSSFKSERRVSIKQDNKATNKNISHLEFVCEKPERFERCRSLSAGSGAIRPNSLLIAKKERNHFKLMRSSSVDYDDGDPNQHKADPEEDENAPLVFTINKTQKLN